MSLATNPAILYDMWFSSRRSYIWLFVKGTVEGFICDMRQSRLFLGRVIGGLLVGAAWQRLFQEALRQRYSVFWDAKRYTTKL